MNKGMAVAGVAALLALAACGKGSETDTDTAGVVDSALSTMPGMGMTTGVGMTTGATTRVDTTKAP
jgi:uncharacterized lipoprotein